MRISRVLPATLWISACMAAQVNAGPGEWTSNGPFGGQITRIGINPENPQHMLAFSQSGVSRVSRTGRG